ncbi:MAG: hypothetical protein KF800_16480 [Lysobacter sp.]|nr:hypothetical protein [Lysobacter sp.]
MKLRIGSVVVLPGVVFIIPNSCVVRKVVGRVVGTDPGELVRKSGDCPGGCATPAGRAGVGGAQWVQALPAAKGWIPACAGMTAWQRRSRMTRARQAVTSVP